MIENKASNVKDKLDNALGVLIESVYSKLSLIRKNFDSDAEILEILSNSAKQLAIGGNVGVDNIEAVEEIQQYLDLQSMKMLPTSMGDIQRRFGAIPYGWREIDIAAAIASLVITQKVSIKYGGSIIQPSDRRMPDYLRKRTEIDKVVVTKRKVIDAGLLKKARDFLREYFNIMDLPNDEDGLIAFIIEKFSEKKDSCVILLNTEYAIAKYPGRAVVEEAIKLCDDLLSQKKDNIALLNRMVVCQDDFLDNSEDMADVTAFFKNQRNIFDNALAMLRKMDAEKDYLQAESEAKMALSQISSIVNMPSPYNKISELPNLMQDVTKIYNGLLELKKQEVLADIQSAMAELHQTATVKQSDILEKADSALTAKRDAVKYSETITSLDAMKIQIANLRQQYLKALVVVEEPDVKTLTLNRASICFSAKLESEKDVDNYLAKLKEKLMQSLDENDVVQII